MPFSKSWRRGNEASRIMTTPALFYISPEWDKRGRLTRDSLVWNGLDGNHQHIASWCLPFTKRKPLAKGWDPPITMVEKVEKGKQSADFIAACGTTFAVTPAAWKLVRDLVQDSVEALPVKVTHSFTAEKFSFVPIPRGKQPNYLLLHGLFDVPMRQGQQGYWDADQNQYDMSLGEFNGLAPELCGKLWLDPDEFAGKHLFLIQGDWVASAEFVDRVRAKKLSGLVFHPIQYVAKQKPAPVRIKKVMPKPPKPDFASASKGYSPKLVEQWQAMWEWTIEALQNRGWPARKPKIKPPLTIKQLRDFESKHGITLPRDYADVLTKFASAVTVDLGYVEIDDPVYQQREEIERRLRNLMFAGEMELWSFRVPVREYKGFKRWADSVADAEPDSEYHQHFRNKLPIMQILNGDYIALDLKTGVPTYLSHEGDDRLQGKPLGKNFVDFITRWSWVGLPWSDFLPGTEFYDVRTNRLPESSPALSVWHAWLRGAPLPAE
jgi:hypothetical protein